MSATECEYEKEGLRSNRSTFHLKYCPNFDNGFIYLV